MISPKNEQLICGQPSLKSLKNPYQSNPKFVKFVKAFVLKDFLISMIKLLKFGLQFALNFCLIYDTIFASNKPEF